MQFPRLVTTRFGYVVVACRLPDVRLLDVWRFTRCRLLHCTTGLLHVGRCYRLAHLPDHTFTDFAAFPRLRVRLRLFTLGDLFVAFVIYCVILIGLLICVRLVTFTPDACWILPPDGLDRYVTLPDFTLQLRFRMVVRLDALVTRYVPHPGFPRLPLFTVDLVVTALNARHTDLVVTRSLSPLVGYPVPGYLRYRLVDFVVTDICCRLPRNRLR